MGTYKEAFRKLVNGFERENSITYTFYDFSNKKFERNAQSRICHVSFKDECDYNRDALLMVFTIGNNVGRTVIQSEGSSTANPSSTYPQKIEALRLAKENNWKYIAVAVSAEDFDNETIRDYVVSIESTSYGKATVCVIDDCIEALEKNNKPDFYRCRKKAGRDEYTLAFIKKEKLIDYICFFDNRVESELINEVSNTSSIEEEEIFEHNLYGMHIKLQNDALDDSNSHICIGWSAMGDLSNIITKEDLSARYEATWPNEKVRKKGQDIGQIWRFVKEMQIGDYVVFANGDTCHIGRITSDYYFNNSENPNQDADYVNLRDVEWLIKDIRKSDLSEVFQNSLGAAMSVFRLNDYKSAVNDLLNGTYVKDELLLEEIEEEDIFLGFESWLTSPNNPDYTGKQKYEGYSRAIVKLVDFMYSKNLIEDTDLNDKNIEKYISWVEIYEGSDEAKDFDVNKNSNKAGSAALKKYVKYIRYLITPHVVDFDYSTTKNISINKIFYGVPGCGKSYHIQHKILGSTPYIRTTFYQDYSNTDFVGQILPKVVKGENGEKDTVEYIFNPGPFTLALIKAISNPTDKIALVIEEINRGNAPAIFGDIFQLLDRDDDSISEYGIKNVGMIDYLNAYEFTVGGEKKRYHFDEIKIPGNLDIYATMNTSDQNVYTLDTAFTRRWSKEHIPNEFNGHKIENMYVPGMPNYTWGTFVDAINNQIRDNLESLQVNEDKQVGAFFVKEKDLLENSTDSTEQKAKMFAYKVLEYLWADVSKLDHQVIFNPKYTTFEDIVKDFVKGVVVFNDKLGFKTTVAPVAEAE